MWKTIKDRLKIARALGLNPPRAMAAEKLLYKRYRRWKYYRGTLGNFLFYKTIRHQVK